jgi:hypothetical protein
VMMKLMKIKLFVINFCMISWTPGTLSELRHDFNRIWSETHSTSPYPFVGTVNDNSKFVYKEYQNLQFCQNIDFFNLPLLWLQYWLCIMCEKEWIVNAVTSIVISKYCRRSYFARPCISWRFCTCVEPFNSDCTYCDSA